jgi:Carboxypeptidase regulatory-like domain
MSGLRRLVVAMAWLMIAPSQAFAQGALAGVVTDRSGAVLPGVTVEAARPALIEKVRTAATDGAGRYQIIDLRPGTYTVTFTLPGFSTVKREGIALIGSFVATINAQLAVGAVAETNTVTGEAPVVDGSTSRSVPRFRPFRGRRSLAITLPPIRSCSRRSAGHFQGVRPT